jgi:hypothetical protein
MLLLGTVAWFAGPVVGIAPRLAAQTQEVEEFGPGRLTLREAARALLVLNTPIDTRAFGKEIKGRVAIEEIYNQLSSKKLETAWLVDAEAMSRGRPDFDLLKASINLSRLPRYAPVGLVLQEIFHQTQTDGVVVVRPGFCEITTRKAFATRPRLGFFCWTWVAFANITGDNGDVGPDEPACYATAKSVYCRK